MKTIITTLLALTLLGCELPEVNKPAPVSTYVHPDFKMPEILIGDYVSNKDNFNHGKVSITDKEVIIQTDIYSIVIKVSNDMYFNNCYLIVYLPDGSILKIWERKEHGFINIYLEDGGVEYTIGRFDIFKEGVKPVDPITPVEPVKPVYN